MPSKRKTGSPSKNTDPPLTMRPSEVKLKANAKVPAKPLIELSEEEQMRLINQSGILDKFKQTEAAASKETAEVVEERLPLGEEILNSILYIIPASFLLLLMEILIHQQYQQAPTIRAILDRMSTGVPILAVFVFYTLRYKSYRQMQLFLLLIGTLTPTRLVWLFNKASYTVNMTQAPPLATIWVYCVVQMDLGPALISLLTTASFVWWKGLKLSF